MPLSAYSMSRKLKQHCTCEFSLRIGTVVVGVLSTFLGAIGLVVASFGLTQILPYISGNIKYLCIFVLVVTMSINLIVCSIPLVVAALKKRPLRFLMPWLAIGAATFLIGIITICVLLNVVVYIAPTTIVTIWFWLIVYSYYHELKKNHEEPNVERSIL